MDKKILIQAFINQIENKLAMIVQSAIAAREAATHSESKAEDTYDTRGLEASYLAGAQSKRVEELEALLALFRHTPLRTFSSSDAIAPTALVELASDEEAKPLWVLLMPKGGGLVTNIDGKSIQVVTALSPLGEALVNRRMGEEIQVDVGSKTKDYCIKHVY
jgi:transcription elongation GreA/GreB family factor